MKREELKKIVEMAGSSDSEARELAATLLETSDIKKLNPQIIGFANHNFIWPESERSGVVLYFTKSSSTSQHLPIETGFVTSYSMKYFKCDDD